MPKDPTSKSRVRAIELGKTLAEEVSRYRHERNLAYDADSMRTLIGFGIQAWHEEAEREAARDADHATDTKPTKVRKYRDVSNRRVMYLTAEQQAAVRAYQLANRHKTESSAVRSILTRGLAAIAARNQHQP
jgi:hypothetical protein